MNSEKHDLLTGLHSLLRYHRSIGITDYWQNDDVASFLHFLPQASENPELARQNTAVGTRVSSLRKIPKSTKSLLKIADIAAEVAGCHACDLHKERLYPVAGHGPDKVRLLIVGDWLPADEKETLPPGLLFGVQQDEMLGKMLMAINLSADEVFVTNVIKCAVPASCQPQASHVQRCVSFLRRQIVALEPEIICTMGMVAARAVLERSQPLSRLRGQFHAYGLGEAASIPVIATYHPTFLLQNPEMKQATWADLQLLAKKMGLK